MSGFDLEPTYRVSELNEEIRDIVCEAFRGLWVRGEVHRPRPSRRGHFYFELVEKGRGDQIVGKIDAVIWRTDYERIARRLRAADQRLDDGVEIRCQGGLDFWAPAGRLQLVVRDVDPMFTLGRLELRRRQTLSALRQAGLMELNKGLPLSPLPLRLALITSEGSAAHRDFVSGLEDSGFGFRVVLIHASMQGKAAEPEVSAALAMAGDLRLDGEPLDGVVLVRGGGSKSDLAAFDSRRIAEAVCRCHLPVICGLGHEIDRSIADEVCHTAVKTPTQAAETLVRRIQTQDASLLELRRRIADAAERGLRAAKSQMLRAESPVRIAGIRLGSQRAKLDQLTHRLERAGRRALEGAEQRHRQLTRSLAASAVRRLDQSRDRPDQLARRIALGAEERLRRQSDRLDGMGRWAASLAPERILERGFSLTTNRRGEPIRVRDQVRSGEQLITRLARGVIVSRVEETQEHES